MIESIIALDTFAFDLINHLPHPSLADILALLVTTLGNAGMIWHGIAVYAFFRYRVRRCQQLLSYILAYAAQLLMVDYILKPFVARVRPDVSTGAYIYDRMLYDYSFPSGHTTIAFAMATTIASYVPQWKWWLYALATLIAFTRVYLGHHYPGDVLAGAVLGWGIGKYALLISKKFAQVRRKSRG